MGQCWTEIWRYLTYFNFILVPWVWVLGLSIETLSDFCGLTLQYIDGYPWTFSWSVSSVFIQSPTPAQSKYPGYTCRKKLALCFAPWVQWQTIKADCLNLFRQTVFIKAVTLDPALLMNPRTQIIFCGEI